MKFQHKLAVAILFVFCVLFFLERGAYRNIWLNKSYDFSTVYAAARCWTFHENPYDAAQLKNQLEQAAAPPALVSQQDVNPCLYFISAMPLIAPVTWMSWKPANVTWCLAGLVSFAAALLAILARTRLSNRAKWVVAGLSLLFCPTYVGVLYGNPAVIAISLVTLAVCFALDRRLWSCGILLGIALCLKPQVALVGVGALLMWRYWPPMVIAAAILALGTAAGIFQVSDFGQHWDWWYSQRRNITLTFAPGGKSDPSFANPWSSELLNAQSIEALFFRNALIRDLLLWSLAGIAVIVYLRFRTDHNEIQPWTDVSFCCAVVIAVTYNRYYDAQIFLLLIPLLVLLWCAGRYGRLTFLTICLVLLAFPSQTLLHKLLGSAFTVSKWQRLIILRHQPLAVIGIALFAIWQASRPIRQQVQSASPS